MNRPDLVEYSVRLARVSLNDVRFVILDGSTAEGSDRRYSDWDIVVVRKGLTNPPGTVDDLFGLHRGRIVSGWLVDDESFKHRYLGDDDTEFLWRRRQLRKAKLLYGDKEEFRLVVKKALARRWSKRRQIGVVEPSYVTMTEYMGKMLNKTAENQGGSPEFYQDGYMIAKNTAIVVAALNRIDLDSDKDMFRQVFARAKLRPPNLERDFKIASGLTNRPRGNAAIVSASRRLLQWTRKQILASGLVRKSDPGFTKLLNDVKF